MPKPKTPKYESPTSGAISPESRSQWLEFCSIVNEGLARPYTDSAIANRLFELGVETVMVGEHRIAWRDHIRRTLLGCQTHAKKNADILTTEERAVVDRFLARVELTQEAQQMFDEWNALPPEEQRKRAK